jgi:hypothetical protein
LATDLEVSLHNALNPGNPGATFPGSNSFYQQYDQAFLAGNEQKKIQLLNQYYDELNDTGPNSMVGMTIQQWISYYNLQI